MSTEEKAILNVKEKQNKLNETQTLATFGVLPMVKSENLPMVLLVTFLPMVTRKP